MLGTLNLFVPGTVMEKAVVLSSSSAATGYAKENLLGYNLNRYWKPTTTGDQVIVIDLGSAKQVDAAGCWIHNYATSHYNGTTAHFKVSYSSDNVTYTQWFNGIIASGWTVNSPVLMFTPGAAQTYRYWKIEFIGMATTIEVSQIWLCRKFDLKTAGEWPRDDSPKYDNARVETSGGGLVVARRAKQGGLSFSRKLYYTNATDFANLRNAHDQSFGSLYPFVYWENDGVSDYSIALVARFDQDSIPEAQQTYGYYRPEVKFRQVPFVQDGETL